MSENLGDKRLTPPYIPYKTFANFLEKQKIGLPSRIDRSVMPTSSGDVKVKLLATLLYLDLIDVDGTPKGRFSELVRSDGENKKKILKDIITASYPFLFDGEIDLTRTTSSHLQEVFETGGGVSGGTTRKCISFFIAISKEAGIELSPHIKIRGSSSRSVPRKINSEKNIRLKSADIQLEEKTFKTQADTQNWTQQLLSKFPSFDPAWPDEVKAKWFDGFKELMDLNKKE